MASVGQSSQPTKSTTTPTPTQPSKPPVTLHPTAHLDPGAYVRGTHAITISSDVLIHPRAHLISLHGPLFIDSGTIINEKTLIGGPPLPTNPSDTTTNQEPLLQTNIGPNVCIGAHAQIHAGATLNEACSIDAHAIIHHNVTIGAHAKIGAQCVVDRDVGDGEVVFNNGRQGQVRRKKARHVVAVAVVGEAGNGDVVDKARLKALEVDRQVTVGLLRAAARASVARKK